MPACSERHALLQWGVQRLGLWLGWSGKVIMKWTSSNTEGS